MKPIAKVVNNNQEGWKNIVETEPNVTLLVGTELYTKEQVYKSILEELDIIKNAYNHPNRKVQEYVDAIIAVRTAKYQERING